MPDPDAAPAAGTVKTSPRIPSPADGRGAAHVAKPCAPACEVSGGLDSSALFAILDSLQRSGELNAPDVEGYTLLTGPEAPTSELAYPRSGRTPWPEHSRGSADV